MIKNLTGIILRTRDWGEKDLFVSVLTERGERIELVAKGAGNPRSRRRAHLESMNLIRATLYESPHRNYLQSPQVENSFYNFKIHADLVFRFSVFIEILEKSLPGQTTHPEIYHLLLETLEGLNESPHPLLPEIALIKLAHLFGFLPSFKQCAHCHQSLTEAAHFDSEAGTLACDRCRKETHRSVPIKYCKAFEFFRAAPSRDCQKVKLALDEHETLREWIPSFFSLHLGKPLKSLQIGDYARA